MNRGEKKLRPRSGRSTASCAAFAWALVGVLNIFAGADSAVASKNMLKLKKVPKHAETSSFSQRVLNSLHQQENSLLQELGFPIRTHWGRLNEELLREVSTSLLKTKTYHLADGDLNKVMFLPEMNLVPGHHPEHGMPPHPLDREYKKVFHTVETVLSKNGRKKPHPVLALTAPSTIPSAEALDAFNPDKIARRLGIVFGAREAFHQDPKIRRELAHEGIALRTVFEQAEGEQQVRRNPVEPVYMVRLNYAPKTETQSSPVLSFLTIPNKNAVAGVDELIKIKTINRLIDQYNADYRATHDW